MSGYRYSALVVDDEEAVRKLTVRALERHGFHCTEAQDGAEAACLLAARHYHALVSDLRMPNGNGYSLTSDVLERAERPLVVILTGVLEPRLAQDLLRRGVDDIMFKPVDYEMFAGKVAGLMARRIDQGAERPEGALSIGSPEINGLTTAREAKAMIDGQHAGESNPLPEDAAQLARETDGPCALQVPVVPINADATTGVDFANEHVPKKSDAAIPPGCVPRRQVANASRGVTAGATTIRRWAATALHSLAGKEFAWLAAAGLLLISIWLSMQLHMMRQMNRAVDVLEQVGARIAVSKTIGASAWFEPDRRPSEIGELHGVPNLRRLELAHTRATNEDLETIGKLTDLEELDLRQTEITDSGLAHLKNLSHLRRLSLRGTQVTDAGIAHLRRLRALRELSLLETGVSAKGAQELRKAMPLTRIDHASLVPNEGDESPSRRDPEVGIRRSTPKED
ncbi:MAG: response regulator [Pirellulales bacterium]